jgi:hypothetical protein
MSNILTLQFINMANIFRSDITKKNLISTLHKPSL